MVAIKFYPKATNHIVTSINNNSVKSTEINGNNRVSYYYFVGTSDFSIVWSNVVVFGLAHLFFVYMYYEFYFNSDGDKLWTHMKSLIWSKFNLLFILCPVSIFIYVYTSGCPRFLVGSVGDRWCPSTMGTQVLRCESSLTNLLYDRIHCSWSK